MTDLQVQYQESKSHASADEYGKELARLGAALEALQVARRLEDEQAAKQAALVMPVINGRKALQDKVAERYAVCKKDNETIYFSVVPRMEEMDTIDAKLLVKVY